MQISRLIPALFFVSLLELSLASAQELRTAPRASDALTSTGTGIGPVWGRFSPITKPTPRSFVAMAYDAVSKKVVMFGGYSGYSYLNGTWLFDGVNWTKVKTPVAPPRRANAQMAYDIVTKRVVLFGGYDGSKYLGDTWTWDGATSSWTQATPAHSRTAVTGPMVFAVPNGRVADFGRFDGSLYQGTCGNGRSRLESIATPDGSLRTIFGWRRL